MSYEVEFYKRPNGRQPVDDFLREILKKDKRMFARISRDIQLFQERGREVGEPRVKYMNDGLFELRSKAENGIARIFYIGEKIVMTNGFVKKSQKTPSGELEKAFRYKKDY